LSLAATPVAAGLAIVVEIVVISISVHGTGLISDYSL
jgi:hypothetical protein